MQKLGDNCYNTVKKTLLLLQNGEPGSPAPGALPLASINPLTGNGMRLWTWISEKCLSMSSHSRQSTFKSR
jgi:hypothetical protein